MGGERKIEGERGESEREKGGGREREKGSGTEKERREVAQRKPSHTYFHALLFLNDFPLHHHYQSLSVVLLVSLVPLPHVDRLLVL